MVGFAKTPAWLRQILFVYHGILSLIPAGKKIQYAQNSNRLLERKESVNSSTIDFFARSPLETHCSQKFILQKTWLKTANLA